MRRYALRSAILGLLVGLTSASFAQTPTDIIALELEKPLERELAVGQAHSYQIKLQAGECAHLEVEQRGINVLLNAFAPDGSYLLFVDNQWNTQGTEEVVLVAGTSGTFRLWIGVQASPQAKNIPPGKYEVRLVEWRTATATDQLRFDATKAYSEMVKHGQRLEADARQHTLHASQDALRWYEELKDYRAVLATRVYLQNYFQRLSDKPPALENLTAIQMLLPQLNDPLTQANQLIGNGLSYRGFYEWQQALASYEQAYRLFDAQADQDGMIRATNGMARIHTDTLNYRKTIALRTKALPYYRAKYDRNFTAYLLQEIGRAYRNLGDYDNALAPLQESLQLYQATGNQEGAYDSWFSLGLLYSLMARETDAIDAYEHALQLAQQLGFTNEVVQVTVSIGQVYERLRESAKAQACIEKAAALPRSRQNSRIPEAFVLGLLGQQYFTRGNEEKAIEYYQQAVANAADFDGFWGKGDALGALTFLYESIQDFARLREANQQLLNFAQKAGYKDREVDAWGGLSTALMEGAAPLEFWQKREAQTQKAAEYLEQARALRQTANNPLEAFPLARLSLHYAVTGDRQKALSYCQRALRLSEVLGLHEQRMVKSLLSQTYAYWGEQQKALDLLWPVSAPRFDLPEREASYRYLLATRLRSVGRLSEAKEQLEKAIEVSEFLRSAQKDQEIQTRLSSTFAGFYEEYIDLLQQMYEQQPQQSFDRQAFLASERGRARGLLETMSNAKVEVRLDADPRFLARQQVLQQKINTLAALERAQQQKQPDASLLAATRKDIDEALEQLRRVQTQIKLSSPRYSAVTQPQIPTLAEVQTQLLEADTLLLSYALGKTHSYLWAITKDSLTSYQLPARDEITQATRRVYDLLTARQQPGKTEIEIQQADAAYQQAAASLSQMLLGSVAAQLGQKRLLIVAPEALQYLPFGALPKPVVGSQLSVVGGTGSGNRQPTTDNRQPMIVNHEIISLPSVSVLMLLRQELAQRKPAPKAVAVLADPVFEMNDLRVKTKALTKAEVAPNASSPLVRSLRSFEARAGLARLLLSRDEAEAIAAAVPATERLKALDFQASRTAAMSVALSQYRIVHFATHGLLNAERPELSGLVFSMVDEKGNPQDGFLRLHEIYNLQLPADLVVLSACQSGLGKEIKGEGLIGLTRGFMYAGAARVVASLWRVDDYATSVLMKKFYRGMLREKLPAAAALRKAQIEMWRQKQWQSPFYWGAFVLQGEWK